MYLKIKTYIYFKNDYEDGSASQNSKYNDQIRSDPNIKNKTTDINSGKIEKELLVSNISKTGEKVLI